MKKILALFLALTFSLLLFPAALAITEGDYAWNGLTLVVNSVNTRPMFAPAGITDDQYPIAVELQVPAVIWEDEALYNALYEQSKLVDEDGVAYAPGAATSKDQMLTLLFAVDRTAEVDALALQFLTGALSGIPAEYIGEWAGSVDNINLSFNVGADGTGTYTFEQSGYHESYDFALAIESETFSVQIPKNNKLGIVTCEGTYSYAGGVLTLEVQTTFANGGTFSYTIPCEQISGKMEALGSTSDVFPVDYTVYGESYSLFGYQINADEDGNTVVSFRGEGIVFLKDPNGNSVDSVKAVFEIEGAEHEIAVSSYTLHASAPINSLSTTPLENDLVFKLGTSASPDQITLINTETGEVVLSFLVEEVAQMSATSE